MLIFKNKFIERKKIDSVDWFLEAGILTLDVDKDESASEVLILLKNLSIVDGLLIWRSNKKNWINLNK